MPLVQILENVVSNMLQKLQNIKKVVEVQIVTKKYPKKATRVKELMLSTEYAPIRGVVDWVGKEQHL